MASGCDLTPSALPMPPLVGNHSGGCRIRREAFRY